MKLNEVLHQGGVEAFFQPSTMVNQQVVLPRTLQADEPEQAGKEYEKAKSRQKGQKKIEVDVYNRLDTDEIEDPYEKPEELEKKIKKTVFALDNKEIADIDVGWEGFAKKIREVPEFRSKRFVFLKPNSPN
jgi:hypothetical protein